MAARGGRAEHADRRRRVPALLVMMEVDAARDARLGLPARDIGGDERPPVHRARLRQSEQRRQDRRRWVSAKRVAAIVEIQRMRRGAVDQRRIQRCHALVGAEHQTRAVRRGHARDDPRARFARAGQRAADRVEDRDARPMHRILRQRVVADTGDPFGQGFGDGHDGPPARAMASVSTDVSWSQGTRCSSRGILVIRVHRHLPDRTTPPVQVSPTDVAQHACAMPPPRPRCRAWESTEVRATVQLSSSYRLHYLFVLGSGRKFGRSFDWKRGWSGPACLIMTLAEPALKHAPSRCRGGQAAMLDRSLGQRPGVIRPGRRNGPPAEPRNWSFSGVCGRSIRPGVA